MNAVAVPVGRVRPFASIIRTPHARPMFLSENPYAAPAQEVADQISAAMTIMSDEFSPARMVQVTASDHVRSHRFHQLRLYTGAALIGAVLSGLALGWTEYRDLLQVVGAVIGVLIYAATTRRRR